VEVGSITGRHALAAAIVGLFGMLVFISLFSATVYRFSGLEVQASVHVIDGGVTEVVVPPLGSVRAHTHMPPLKYRLELRAIDAGQLQDIASLLGAPNIAAQLEMRLRAFMRGFLVRVTALGGLGGAALALAVGFRHPGRVALAALTGLVVLSVFVLVSVGSYTADAFEEPQFTGALAAAPWMVGLAEQSVSKFIELGEQMKLLMSNLYRMFESVKTLSALGEIASDRTILVVADIHNNPAAISMIGRVVEAFRPDFIIDAGDITDYGTDLEFEGLRRLAELQLPYILVPGNHDSPPVISQLETLPNVQVLANQLTVVQGVRLYGVVDPGAKSLSPDPATSAEVEGRIIAASHSFQRAGVPSVFIAHDPRIARPFFTGEATSVPVVISGHTHRLSLRTEGQRVWIDPGTTGAAGIRGLMSPRELPYSLVLLYLQQDEPNPDSKEGAVQTWRPVAVDTLRVYNLEGSFTIERKLMNP